MADSINTQKWFNVKLKSCENNIAIMVDDCDVINKFTAIKDGNVISIASGKEEIIGRVIGDAFYAEPFKPAFIPLRENCNGEWKEPLVQAIPRFLHKEWCERPAAIMAWQPTGDIENQNAGVQVKVKWNDNQWPKDNSYFQNDFGSFFSWQNRAIAAETELKRVRENYQMLIDLWAPVDEFVRPLTQLGHSVSEKALCILVEHKNLTQKS